MSHYFRSCCRSHDSEDDELSLWPSRAASARKSKSLLLDESIAFVYYFFASSIPESKYIIAVRWWHGGGGFFCPTDSYVGNFPTRANQQDPLCTISTWTSNTDDHEHTMNYSSPFENEARKDIRSTYYGIDRNELLESASSGGSDNGQNFRGIFKQSGEQRQSGSLAYIIRRCSRWELKVL